MWWTSEGERVLRGAEWELFREGIGRVWDLVEDEIRDDDSSGWGVPVFDDLLPGQKLALLALVGEALGQEGIACPDLTSHVDSIIAFIYTDLRAAIETEVGLEGDGAEDEVRFFWRRLVLSACREVPEEWDEPLPEATCADVDEWGIIIDCFAQRILWDYDFEIAPDFLDKQSDEASSKKEEMGIAKNYFTAIAPDPTASELVEIRRRLRKITARPG